MNTHIKKDLRDKNENKCCGICGLYFTKITLKTFYECDFIFMVFD